MEIRACTRCGSTEFVKLTVVTKRKGFFGGAVKTVAFTHRCFNCKVLTAQNCFWADESLLQDDRTVPLD